MPSCQVLEYTKYRLSLFISRNSNKICFRFRSGQMSTRQTVQVLVVDYIRTRSCLVLQYWYNNPHNHCTLQCAMCTVDCAHFTGIYVIPIAAFCDDDTTSHHTQLFDIHRSRSRTISTPQWRSKREYDKFPSFARDTLVR
jgi:hypothetical protein